MKHKKIKIIKYSKLLNVSNISIKCTKTGLPPISTMGHVILSSFLVVLAFGESTVRAVIAKRMEQSDAKENKPKEFRKARVGMPEVEGVSEPDDSPWRDPITL